MAPGVGPPAVAGTPDGRGPRVHPVLHPLLAVLAQPGQPLHRSLPPGPRGHRQRDHPGAPPSSTTAIPTIGSMLLGRRVTAPRTSASGTCPRRPTPTWRPTGSPTGTATTATSWDGPAPASTSTRSSPRTPPTGSGPTPAGRQPTGRPWFFTVALVNPHDVMWFPIDQPGYDGAHPDEVAGIRRILDAPPGRRTTPFPVYTDDYDEVFEALPANFSRRPAHQARGAPAMAVGPAARSVGLHRPRATRKAWLRHLDYYVSSTDWPTGAWGPCSRRWRRSGLGRHGGHLHLRPRRHVRVPRTAVQGALRLRRDHAGPALREGARGDRAGHLHRGAGHPCRPGRHHLPPGRRRPGAAGRGRRTLSRGRSRRSWPTRRRRCATTSCSPRTRRRPRTSTTSVTRLRGFFDGTTKYARYYGVGGGQAVDRPVGEGPGHKLFDVDCDFDDQDHEWYDHDDDPVELVNLANDRAGAPSSMVSSTTTPLRRRRW